MTSFRSRHYPRTGQRVVVFQEYAMRYYAIFFSVYFLLVLLMIFKGRDITWPAIFGAVAAILAGNVFAYAALKRRIAEIFFVNESFTVVTIHDIVSRQPGRSFPLRLANPFRTGDEIQFVYEDQLLSIRKEDWEAFDLIWNWLNSSPPKPEFSYIEEDTDTGAMSENPFGR